MKFSEKDGHGHGTGSNLEYFRDVTVNPLNLGSINLFPGSVFVCKTMENGWTDFHEFFFHTCLDYFTVSHLGAPGVFVSNYTVKSMSGFSWTFQDMLAMTQETICNILGMIGLNPLTQGSFFYFFRSCLLATLRNIGWMDIHEIVRIWTQEAIGHTVSRLSRLFYALQTRRGGSLRSLNASCYILFWNTWFVVFTVWSTSIWEQKSRWVSPISWDLGQGIVFSNLYSWPNYP